MEQAFTLVLLSNRDILNRSAVQLLEAAAVEELHSHKQILQPVVIYYKRR